MLTPAVSINRAPKISTAAAESVRRHGLAAASGLLLGLSFPPYSMHPFAWVALTPLIWLWHRHTSWRVAYLDATVAFLVTFAVAFQWPLFHAFPKTAFLSAPFLLVLPMWMAIPFAVSHVVKRRLGSSLGLAALTALFIVIELSLRRGPLAFPWPLLGHTQASLHPIDQLASIGGVPLLSLFVLLLNIAAFAAVRGRYAAPVAVSMVLVALLSIPIRSEPVSTGSLRVGLVQPAVPAQAWADFTDTTRVPRLLDLAQSLADRADLIVWPETAIPPGTDVSRISLTTPLLSGGITQRGELYRNSALLFQAGGPPQAYHKIRLVPFAEHVPFREHLPWLTRLAVPAGGVSGYLPGTVRKIFEIPGARFGVLICFESLFDDLAHAYARDGADLLIVITQDGWWGDSFGYRQHLAFNRLRALETGLAVVQVSVSGYSAVIDPSGGVRSRRGWMEREAWIEDVPIHRSATVYTRIGDFVSPAALLASLLLLGWAVVGPGLSRRESAAKPTF